MKILVDINHNYRVLAYSRVLSGANAPSPAQIGMLYVDTDDGKLYYHDGSQWVALSTGSGDGLQYWEELQGGSIPSRGFRPINASQPHVNACIVPKGEGAILGSVPDGTSSGGNARGYYAVDLQRSRDSADQVASGDYSVIMGGDRNRNDGDYSVLGGGKENTINENSPYSVLSGGNVNVIDKRAGIIIGGIGARVINYGAEAKASAYFDRVGDGQRGSYTLYAISRRASTSAFYLNSAVGSEEISLYISPGNGYGRCWQCSVGVTAIAYDSYRGLSGAVWYPRDVNFLAYYDASVNSVYIEGDTNYPPSQTFDDDSQYLEFIVTSENDILRFKISHPGDSQHLNYRVVARLDTVEVSI